MNRTKATRSIVRWFKEPLLHFLLMGACIYVAFGLFGAPEGDSEDKLIQVNADRIEAIVSVWESRWNRPPTSEELNGLIQKYIQEEMLYREALALGLDQDDPFIRMRLRQKLEFILEDLTAEEPPDDEKLAVFLAENPERYEQETQISFQQIYLNPDKRQDVAGDAEQILQELQAGAVPETLGDTILMQSKYDLVTRTGIARQFGYTFATAVAALEPGDWTGPLHSGFGGHLVKVSERIEGRAPGLEEVREQVERDWLARRRQDLKDAAYTKLLEGYEVMVEEEPDLTKTEP